MKYNQIQLFALNVPTQISLPFNLYAIKVPKQWKELFTRLQEYKLDKSPVLPPIECLNRTLELLIEDLLFPNPNAFRISSDKNWFYSQSDLVNLDYFATVVKIWAHLAFKGVKCLNFQDEQSIQALSGRDLHWEKVNLPENVWEINGGKLIMDELYYSLIPYLLSKAIASQPLEIVNPCDRDDRRIFHFRESIISDSSSSELVSWHPEIITGGKEKKSHFYSYYAKFKLDYHPNLVPYINCHYGVRRWVNWELGFLPTATTVNLSPTGSERFAPVTLQYMGKKRGIDFEDNLGQLIQELKHQDRFSVTDIIKSPYKNDGNGLEWATVYNNRMSKQHYQNPGLCAPDIASFYLASLERIQQSFGNGFSTIEPYLYCENRKVVKNALKQHNQVIKFIKSNPLEKPQTIPFNIPADIRLLVLAQDSLITPIIEKLAAKYGIKNFKIINFATLGRELPGNNWTNDCKQRIQEFQNSSDLKDVISTSSNQKTLVLLEILPKSNFEKTEKTDPKPCFRPALAQLGCVAKCFEPQKDEEDMPKRTKDTPEVDFARRLENTLLRGLAMTGAYLYPPFETENFPANVACVGVYAIPCYPENKRKYFPVAVRIDRDGIMAKGYGSLQWLNIYDFQIEMCRGNIFKPIDSKTIKLELQRWVFNNLFEETQQPTIYCFDALNLRSKGLLFLQKKYWRKDRLAFCIDKEQTDFIPLSKYPKVRVASILTPESLEVPIYRACDKSGNLAGHTKGVFYSSSQDSECGHYYLPNQKPSNRSDTLLRKSKIFSMMTESSERTKPQPSAQGYNPREILLSLILQENDLASDWASLVQCYRTHGLIHHVDATNYPAALHLAEGLRDFIPLPAIPEP